MTLFLLALSACGTEPVHPCTDLYAYSVTAHVTSADGLALTGVAGSYTVDGGAAQPCSEWIAGSDLVCGGETVGHFVVTVTADGHDPMTLETDVVMDDEECHVIGQPLDFPLEASAVDCTEEVRPSVLVTLTAADGGALVNPWMTWEDPAADRAPEACVPDGLDQWRCADEVAGTLLVSAGADGYADGSWTGTVELTDDGCHVETQSAAIALEPLLR